ncbi:MAG: BLUF domain-containing protein [Alphaproteobacteria bacterium]|nr:MAG: BLUF domain-containing protein [Alphaproteobacteria bacterium]
MLFRIIYSSRITRFLSRQELQELCHRASERNRRDNITGLFLCDGVRFLQAIEGEREVVEALMHRIGRDDRHTNISYAYRGFVTDREFPDWSMQEPFGPGDDPTIFVQKVGIDVQNVSNPHLQAQFIGFARLAASSKSRI